MYLERLNFVIDRFGFAQVSDPRAADVDALNFKRKRVLSFAIVRVLEHELPHALHLVVAQPFVSLV